jgi:hypothetical protein
MRLKKVINNTNGCVGILVLEQTLLFGLLMFTHHIVLVLPW